MKNKVLKTIIFSAFIAALPLTVKASTKDLSIRVNNVDVRFNTVPYILENRLLISVRELFEIYGYEVSWNNENRTAVCTKAGKTVVYFIDTGKITIDGKEITEGAELIIKDGRIYTSEELIELALDTEVE